MEKERLIKLLEAIIEDYELRFKISNEETLKFQLLGTIQGFQGVINLIEDDHNFEHFCEKYGVD